MDAITFQKLKDIEERHRGLEAEMLRLASSGGAVSSITKTAKEASDIKPIVEAFGEYKRLLAEVTSVDEMAKAETDAELRTMALDELKDLQKRRDETDAAIGPMLIPKDPNDEKNVLLEIRAGTGGDEAALFAQEVFRMYQRYAERHKWKIDVISMSRAGAGGIKEVIALIEGDKVYSKLRFESGVHRVQRVPATEAQGRIHTSTITVAVLPEAEEVDVKIEAKDIRIDTFCSSGPGGQSVNTTYSAVRITHLPTSTVVSCQDEKSQIKNREKAMKVLRSRLYEVALAEQNKEISADRKSQVGTGDRSEKIRTYNFPQSRLTDHRIGLTLHTLQTAMDGDIDALISQLVATHQAERVQAAN
ncbi:MAG: peptide chain release factor 1 [Vicinamibacteria bacterium]